MKNRAIKVGIIASLLPHIFCCGLPIALSVVGLFAPEFSHAHFMPEWLEPWILVFSGVMMLLSWVLVMRDCECGCDKCAGARHHKLQRVILSVITIFFILSVVMHFLTHHH